MQLNKTGFVAQPGVPMSERVPAAIAVVSFGGSANGYGRAVLAR